jgi:hypothetical protein
VCMVCVCVYACVRVWEGVFVCGKERVWGGGGVCMDGSDLPKIYAVARECLVPPVP